MEARLKQGVVSRRQVRMVTQIVIGILGVITYILGSVSTVSRAGPESKSISREPVFLMLDLQTNESSPSMKFDDSLKS